MCYLSRNNFLMNNDVERNDNQRAVITFNWRKIFEVSNNRFNDSSNTARYPRITRRNFQTIPTTSIYNPRVLIRNPVTLRRWNFSSIFLHIEQKNATGQNRYEIQCIECSRITYNDIVIFPFQFFLSLSLSLNHRFPNRDNGKRVHRFDGIATLTIIYRSSLFRGSSLTTDFCGNEFNSSR